MHMIVYAKATKSLEVFTFNVNFGDFIKTGLSVMWEVLISLLNSVVYTSITIHGVQPHAPAYTHTKTVFLGKYQDYAALQSKAMQ